MRPIENRLFDPRRTVGWREWLALPELGIPAIKAKVDTGARTSALHAFEVQAVERDGITRVQFSIHPLQHRLDVVLTCEADIIEQRLVTDSGGHTEERFVIRSPVTLFGVTWPIEISLTNRENMKFRMLLGRTAMHAGLRVNPSRSYLAGRELASSYAPKKKETS